MRSGSYTHILVGLAVAAVAALAFAIFGVSHTTTQQTSQRKAVEADRDLTAQKPIKASPADPAVKVVHTSLVRAGKSAALVAVLRNTTSKPVNDLPLAAGVRKGGAPDYVNLKGASYWQNHGPAIAPHSQATWILSGRKALPAGAAIATVTRPKGRLPAEATSLPTLDVTATGATGRTVTARVDNPTNIPQYRLEVYAWARKGARVVAAGEVQIPFLDGGANALVRVPLVGDVKGARVHVEAPPTIFQ